MIEISPSILAADFSNLQSELSRVSSATYLHLDVMDGRYVPNITFGPGLIKALRPHSNLKFDTHLMIENPDRYIKDFAEAGSDLITVHVESTKHLDSVIQKIKHNQCQAGVALNPGTSLSELEYVLNKIDLVLIMSVNPGFGGQKFISYSYEKIRKLSQMITNKKLDIKISVDGGINTANIGDVYRAGADIIVAGSAIFKTPNPEEAIKKFKSCV